MEREEIKKQLRDLSKEGEGGTVLPAALLDIMEAGEKSTELAEKNIATLQDELNNVQTKSETTSAEHATKTKGILDGMQEKHDTFAADVHKKLLWSISLSAVAIAAVLIVIVMIGLSQYA